MPTFSRQRNGQSLAEVIIAIAVGTIFIIGAASIIAPALRASKQVSQVQTQAALANELLENVRSWAAGNWTSVASLATTSAYSYYLLSASSTFVATSGQETVTVSTSTYLRYFYIDDVYRDANGFVTSTATTLDPSTKRITVVYGFSGGTTTTAVLYLTRNQSNGFGQGDWSGGSGQAGPITLVNNKFATSTNITTGVALVELTPIVGGACSQ